QFDVLDEIADEQQLRLETMPDHGTDQVLTQAFPRRLRSLGRAENTVVGNGQQVSYHVKVVLGCPGSRLGPLLLEIVTAILQIAPELRHVEGQVTRRAEQ